MSSSAFAVLFSTNLYKGWLLWNMKSSQQETSPRHNDEYGIMQPLKTLDLQGLWRYN